MKIISKIKIPKTKKIENYINKKICNSLKQLKVKCISGLLLHDTEDLLTMKQIKYYYVFRNSKKL